MPESRWDSPPNFILDEIATVLAGHYGFTAEPACAWHADRELDFILNDDLKYRLGRDSGETGD